MSGDSRANANGLEDPAIHYNSNNSTGAHP